MTTPLRRFVCAAACCFISMTASAQMVDQNRGVDPRVDYASLTEIGPWDDRNYALTKEDLALLSPNEREQIGAIPAFFRVEMRRHWPELRREGTAQYPRSAFQIFKQMFTGYLIDGKFYKGVEREGDRYNVLTDARFLINTDPQRALTGEVLIASGAESSVEINPTDADMVIAGFNGTGQDMFWSEDGGETWTESTPLPLGGTCCDPTIGYSSDGTLAYTSTLGNCGFGGCAIWTYRSDDGGKTWSDLEDDTPGDPRRELTTSGSDKEFIHVDIFPTSPGLDNVYLAWHDGNVQQFAVSTDSTNTWTTTSFTTDPTGIGSDIVTDKQGNIYYFYPATGIPDIRLLKSTDQGMTFAASTTVAPTNDGFDFPVPSMDTRLVFIYVAADLDYSSGPFGNSIYAAWTDSLGPQQGNPADNHARIQVGYSRDGGATWNFSTPHPTGDQMTVDRFHPWLSVDENGVVHVVYYDTGFDADRTSVDFYYAQSTDGAVTWSTPMRLTTETSPKISDGFEWGDYNGLDVVLGQAIAIYTDNRVEGGGSGDSIDVYAIGMATAPPDPSIFADGFESGNTSSWSQTNP